MIFKNRCCFFLLFLFVFSLSVLFSPLFAQINSVKEAMAIEQKLKNSSLSEQKQIYSQLISFYSKVELQKALQLSIQFVSEAKKNKDKRFLADGLNLLGRTYIRMGNFSHAKQIHMEALFVFQSIANDTGVAAQYGNLGVLFEMSGDFPKALLFYHQSYKIYEQLKDIKSIAYVENNIGIVYQQMGIFNQSLAYQHRALAHKQQLGDTAGVASTLNNIGVIYESLKSDLDKSLLYYNQALHLFLKLGNNLQIGTLQNNIGLIYLKQNRLDLAELYLNKGLEIRRGISDKSGEASSLLNLAQLALKQNKSRIAVERAEQSIALYLIVGSKTKLVEAYKTLAEAYEESNNYQKAIQAYKNHVIYRDSVYNENNQKTIHEMQAKYDHEVNQKQLVILEKENQIKSEKLSQNRLLMINMIVFFITLFVVIILYVRQNKIKLENKQRVIKHQLFRAQMNPHFIFNALTSVQNFVLDNNKELGALYISRFGRLMRKILENSSQEFVPLSDELEILKDYVAFQQLRFDDKFTVHFAVDPNIEPELLMVPPMLIQPFIENAIEHGIANVDNGMIHVDFSLKKEQIIVEIIDNGVGVNSKVVNPIFEHKSMAVSIIKDRLKILSKTLKKELSLQIIDLSEINNCLHGTKVVLFIPLKVNL